ncbi:MAG: amidohydrolase family protein [Marinoscillum sp.]
MRIDAHQHFWHYDPVKGSWITDDMQVIRRNFMPADLKPLLDQHAIDGCVAVQADQSESENQFLLDLANLNPWIKGVVGWLDLTADDLQEKLEHYQGYPRFRGVRHVLQAEAYGFMTDPKFVKGVAEVGRKEMSYDILTTENQLEEVVQLVRQLPEMKLVIDHISKPDIRTASYAHWAKQMQLLSEFENVNVKLSGMVTEADWNSWKKDDFSRYIDFCLEHYGSQRLMFGSDWPVCLVAGQYSEIYELLEESIGSLSQSEQTDILGNTAVKFYQLD